MDYLRVLLVDVQIARLCRDSDKRSLFRAWSRLCLHAAALNAADGASAAASAAARVARAESVEKEAVAAAASAEKEEGEELVRRQASVRRGVSINSKHFFVP